jgi:two-component system response regulator RegA
MEVLVVDDDARYRDRLVRAFEDRGWRASGAADHPQALAIAQERFLELAIVDLRLATGSGLSLIATLNEADPDTILLMLTGFGSIATAVSAVRMGAADYLVKPADADQILAAYARARGTHGSSTPAASHLGGPVLTLDQLAWEHIQRTLSECDGNISHAARLLGVHRRSLQRKLQKRPLPPPG